MGMLDFLVGRAEHFKNKGWSFRWKPNNRRGEKRYEGKKGHIVFESNADTIEEAMEIVLDAAREYELRLLRLPARR